LDVSFLFFIRREYDNTQPRKRTILYTVGISGLLDESKEEQLLISGTKRACRKLAERDVTNRNQAHISQLCEMEQHGFHLRCQDGWMLNKKRKKETSHATRASVEKEMAKPRMAKSARITELSLDTARIQEQPSTTMPGTVNKIIPSPRPSQPEKAQIAVEGTDHQHLRIENTLTDENGDDVRLKKGAHVEVTVTAKT
jgi:hypothetical protein